MGWSGIRVGSPISVKRPSSFSIWVFIVKVPIPSQFLKSRSDLNVLIVSKNVIYLTDNLVDVMVAIVRFGEFLGNLRDPPATP